MDGFGFSATLSASFGFTTGRKSTVGSTDGFAFHCRGFTSLPTAF
jgi:hypothetical protein